jgi:hypothetical protein
MFLKTTVVGVKPHAATHVIYEFMFMSLCKKKKKSHDVQSVL